MLKYNLNNLNNICRLCLNEEVVMSNIFENQRKIQNYTLHECIEYIAPIKLSISASLPKLICYKCNYLVEQSFCFRKEIEKSSRVLNELFQNNEIRDTGQLDDNFLLEKTDLILKDTRNRSIEDSEDNIFEDVEFLEESEHSFEEDNQDLNETLENKSRPHDNQNSNNIDNPECMTISLEMRTEVIDDNEKLTVINNDNELLYTIKSLQTSEVTKILCPLCITFCGTTTELFLNHLNEHSPDQNWKMFLKESENYLEYNCTLCNDKNLKRKFDFILHMRRHFNIRPYRCNERNCIESGKSFISKTRLRFHTSNYHNFTDTLNKKHQTIYEYKIHGNKNIGDGIKFQCQYCTTQLSSLNVLRTHERYHLTGKQLCCEFCDKKFYVRSELYRHTKRNHLPDEMRFICEYCGKKFPRNTELARHLRYHTKNRIFKCPDCDKEFFEGYHMKMHRKFVHFKEKEISCELCGKFFANKPKLKRHQLSKLCLNRASLLKMINESKSSIHQIDTTPLQIDDDLKLDTIASPDFFIIKNNDTLEVSSENVESKNFTTIPEISHSIMEMPTSIKQDESVAIENYQTLNLPKINLNVIGIKNDKGEIENYVVFEGSDNDNDGKQNNQNHSGFILLENN